MPKQRRIKGVKGQPGIPTTEYGELKKPVQVTLTPTAIAALDTTAQTLGISRSELVERYGRNPLTYLNEIRSQLKTDFEWVIFWEAIEESICFRHGKEPRKLNALWCFRLLETEDLINGLKAVGEID
jgi:hypothetical protein